MPKEVGRAAVRGDVRPDASAEIRGSVRNRGKRWSMQIEGNVRQQYKRKSDFDLAMDVAQLIYVEDNA